MLKDDGSYNIKTTISQGYSKYEVNTAPGDPAYESKVNVSDDTSDTLIYGANTHSEGASASCNAINSTITVVLAGIAPSPLLPARSLQLPTSAT